MLNLQLLQCSSVNIDDHQGYSPNGGPFSDHWKDRLGINLFLCSYVNMTVEMLYSVGGACVSSCVITVAVATSHLPSAGFSLPMMLIVGWVWARVSFWGCPVPMVTLVSSTCLVSCSSTPVYIQMALPYLGLLWSSSLPIFFAPVLQSGSSPLLSLHMQSLALSNVDLHRDFVIGDL